MARQFPIIAGIALGGAVLAFSAPAPARLRARVGVEVIEALRAAPEVRVLVSLRPGSGAGPDAARPGAASWEPLEGKVERRLRSAPLLVATITAGDLARLQEAEEVSRIDLDGEVRGAEGPGAIQIGADAVHALGIDGTGVTVALLDTGTDIGENPDLDPALAGEECFCSGGGGCCPDGSSRQSGPGAARSISIHGPGVCGIVTADGITAPSGVAPGARILPIRVLDDLLVGTFSDVLAGLDWVVSERPDVRVINLSIAAGPFPPDCDHLHAFNEAVGALSATLRSRGGVIVAASGNTFDLSRLGSPACVSSVLAVGGVNAGDQVLPYSNTAPTLDLLAPGDRILTTGIYGGQVLLSGTSAAAPHVAGAAALLLSANPGLSADALEERLESHGVPVVDSRTGRTTPRVDALRALLLPARIELLPPVVSFASRGRYLLVRIEPDPPYRAVDLDPDSFTLRLGEGDPLEGTGGAPELGDADGNGISELTLRFARRDLLGALDPGFWPVTVEGNLKSGIAVGGTSSLRLAGREPKGPAREPVP